MSASKNIKSLSKQAIAFVQVIESNLISQVKHNKVSLEKLAFTFGIVDKTEVKELTELAIVNRASDSTIGRVLKKHSQAPSPGAVGHPAEGQQRLRGGHGRRAGRLYAAARS